jgi:hypothetical protein
MRPTMFGVLVGILLGMTWAFASFGAMLGVGLAGLIGLVVAKVLEGELDITEYLGNRTGNRTGSRPGR